MRIENKDFFIILHRFLENKHHIYMELASKYDPKEVEGKWYQYWLDHKRRKVVSVLAGPQTFLK